MLVEVPTCPSEPEQPQWSRQVSAIPAASEVTGHDEASGALSGPPGGTRIPSWSVLTLVSLVQGVGQPSTYRPPLPMCRRRVTIAVGQCVHTRRPVGRARSSEVPAMGRDMREERPA